MQSKGFIAKMCKSISTENSELMRLNAFGLFSHILCNNDMLGLIHDELVLLFSINSWQLGSLVRS